MKSLFLLLLLCLSCLAASAQSVVLNDPAKTYYLQEYMDALELKPGQATIDSLLRQPEKYAFRSLKQKPVTPNEQKVYWFRVTLTNQLSSDLFLHFVYFSNRKVVVYQTDEQRITGSLTFTGFIPPHSDDYYNIRRSYPLAIPKGQTRTIYFYAEGVGLPSLHATVASDLALDKTFRERDLVAGLYIGFLLMVVIYSLLLSIRLGDRDNLFYVVWVLLVGWIHLSFYNYMGNLSPGLQNLFMQYGGVGLYCCNLAHVLFTMSFLSLQQRSTGSYRLSWLMVGFNLVAITLFLTNNAPFILYVLLNLTDAVYCLIVGIVSYRKGFKPALYFILGNTVFYIFAAISGSTHSGIPPTTFLTYNSLYVGAFFEILFYTLGLSYKVNLLKKHQDEAIQEQLRLTQENQTLIESQNRMLEEKVEQRTAELRASQAQLIQKEKLASLGELTAGIAHEIQNPLNFVNNFSEVSTELVDELEEEADAGRVEEVKALAVDLRQNLQKITHHGSRASAIVRGMLEHSRASTGEKQPTNLNALADEYLRLAYQGQKAKNNVESSDRFNCQLITNFDTSLPSVSVVAQDIGRVLLNLYNNAFYAVGQRARQAQAGYEPTVWVGTRQEPGRVVLCVRDNGTGIPDSIREKIFQPFFTTKPTGEGTGLGLSLSYDIITKGHSGTMTVESREGEGAEFIIHLPC